MKRETRRGVEVSLDGELVRRWRGAIGWSQEILAEKIGTTRAELSEIESGVRRKKRNQKSPKQTWIRQELAELLFRVLTNVSDERNHQLQHVRYAQPLNSWDDLLKGESRSESGTAGESGRQPGPNAAIEPPIGQPGEANDLPSVTARPNPAPPSSGQHPWAPIPIPPGKDVVHPYTLMGSTRLVGRRDELQLISDWVADRGGARVLSVVAIGGMGKTALTWEWFHHHAPKVMQPLAGQLWWSFYDDSKFENFVDRALAYVSGQPIGQVRALKRQEREQALFDTLKIYPYLIVLDGLERIMTAFPQLDPARLDEDELDRRTANHVPWLDGSPDDHRPSAIEGHRLRKTTDIFAGEFLARLTYPGLAARILVSTRLCSVELDAKTGCSVHYLTGLNDDDAYEFWNILGIRGDRKRLLDIFRYIYQADCNYPLLIKLLAGVIDAYRPAPRDFDRWCQDHRHDAIRLVRELQPVNKRTHVLEIALRDLDRESKLTLFTVAFFRMPAAYDDLRGILVGAGRLFFGEEELGNVLSELEDRGLLGWDPRPGFNCYDIHPVVRHEIRKGVDPEASGKLCLMIYDYYNSLPVIAIDHVNTMSDLVAAVEKFRSLIGIGRYEDAWREFKEHLWEALAYRLAASRHLQELLEMLLPSREDALPSLTRDPDKFRWLDTLGHALQVSGKVGEAIKRYRLADELPQEEADIQDRLRFLGHFTVALRFSGNLREAEGVARRMLGLSEEIRDRLPIWRAFGLRYVGQVSALRGMTDEARTCLMESLESLLSLNELQAAGSGNIFLAELELLTGNLDQVAAYAGAAERYVTIKNYERDIIHLKSIQGYLESRKGNLPAAEELLRDCIARARDACFLEREIPALVGLADLRRKQGQFVAARERLDEIWELAESGPFRVFHVDALNVLSSIEYDERHTEAAINAAAEACRLAGSDDPAFAYHWGYAEAKAHLTRLGV